MERAGPQDWWRVRSVGDGVTWIDEPHVREFYRCNVWHVRGRDRDMLVDSGMGIRISTMWGATTNSPAGPATGPRRISCGRRPARIPMQTNM